MDGGARRPAALGLGAFLSDWRSIADGLQPVEKPQAGPLTISRGDPPFFFYS
jgi:hypothetical protein